MPVPNACRKTVARHVIAAGQPDLVSVLEIRSHSSAARVLFDHRVTVWPGDRMDAASPVRCGMPEQPAGSFAGLLRHLRLTAGMTQEQLAEGRAAQHWSGQ